MDLVIDCNGRKRVFEVYIVKCTSYRGSKCISNYMERFQLHVSEMDLVIESCKGHKGVLEVYIV